jgi:hypothetical protein
VTREFGNLEAEGDRLNLVSTAAQHARMASSSWIGPHCGTQEACPARMMARMVLPYHTPGGGEEQCV